MCYLCKGATSLWKAKVIDIDKMVTVMRRRRKRMMMEKMMRMMMIFTMMKTWNEWRKACLTRCLGSPLEGYFVTCHLNCSLMCGICITSGFQQSGRTEDSNLVFFSWVNLFFVNLRNLPSMWVPSGAIYVHHLLHQLHCQTTSEHTSKPSFYSKALGPGFLHKGSKRTGR